MLMPSRIKRLRHQMILAGFAMTLTARLSFGGAGSPPVGANKLERRAVSTLWHVKYMGGPNALKRGTRVDLRIAGNTISYQTAGRGPGSEFSIPIADVTAVSDAIIEGDRSENVFGPDEPDFFSPCGKLREPAVEVCGVAGLALETPFAIVKSILVHMPYKDRLVRLAWQRQGEDPAVVFKVSGKDFAALSEELQRVTEKSLANGVRGQASQEALHDSPVTPIDAFDCEVARMRVQRWLSDQCQPGSSERPSWMRSSQNLRGVNLASLEAATGKKQNDLWAERERFLQSQFGYSHPSQHEFITGAPKIQDKSKASEQARCRVLSIDSGKYRENCAGGSKLLL